VKYFLCAPIAENIEKKIKNIRFEFKRNSIKDEVLLIISSTREIYCNLNKLQIFIEKIVKRMGAIKIKIKAIEQTDREIVAYIDDNKKISSLILSLTASGDYFCEEIKYPFIPIIEFYELEESEAFIGFIENEILGKEFFINKLSLLEEKSAIKTIVKIYEL